MGHSRPRFNAKGRNLAGDGSRQAKPQKSAAAAAQAEDANALMIDPAEAHVERLKRREALVQARQQQGEAMSSKKRKRLDKFIDKQLKKERRVQLLKDIEAYESALPADVQLQSSSALGSRKMVTAQDKLNHAQKLQDRKKEKLNARAHRELQDVDSDESQDGEDAAEVKVLPLTAPAMNPTPSTSATTLGSGLKRTADGSMPMPTVTKRRRIRTAWGRLPAQEEMDESSDSSFNSSDSDMDSGSAEEEDEDSDVDEEEEWGGIASERGSDGELHAPPSSEEGLDSKADSDEEEESDEDEQDQPRRQRGSFKAWADAQRDQLEGVTPSIPQLDQPQIEVQSKPRRRNSVLLPSGVGPLGQIVKNPVNSLAFGPAASERKQRLVIVSRPEEIQESRLLLPITAEEDNIMHLIRHQPVVVLSGETGSGKTTQVPQFLYEAGFGMPGGENPGMVGITQPRRVAAVSMAQRVRSELGLPKHSHVVAHQVRYDSTTARETRIKYMTDGVLLRELGQDFLLQKYSVVIVDEAHERTVNTDILLGVLSRVVKLREEMWRKQEQGIKPLRLIIMSATLRLADFLNNTSLFPKQPESISVEARQYPVTVHFSRRTKSDYLSEAFKKVCKIHARLPHGGILVFLTGQNEIQSLCKRLERRWSVKALAKRKAAREMAARQQQNGEASDDEDEEQMQMPQKQDAEAEDMDLGADKDLAEGLDESEPQLTDDEDLESDAGEDFIGLEGIPEDSELLSEESEVPLHILPLYSLLPTEKQMRVFDQPPEGTRLVVIATNVAETSLTIPGIRYVVDSGRAKERQYNTATGMQSFQVSWVSKASAAQRSGRAGRVGPGHCYRLYSSAVFERYLDDHAQPEILRTPTDSMVLQMKAMNIDVVTNFPFPTPPDRESMYKAEKLLTSLGALQVTNQHKSASSLQITDLGRAMALFPLPPRFAKMLVAGQQHGCLPYVIVLVCAMVVGDPFLREEAVGLEDTLEEQHQQTEALALADIQHIRDPEVKAKELRKLQRKQFFQVQAAHSALGEGTSDMFKLLSAVGAYEFEGGSSSFCEKNFLRTKAMEEIHKLRSQISQIVMAHFSKADAGFKPSLPPPSELQLKVLRQLILSSFIDQVAVRKDLVDPSSTISAKHATSGRRVAYRALGVPGEDVFIHPSSVLYGSSPPDFVCYQELFRSSRAWLKTNTKISANWLSTLGKTFCSFTKVLESPDQLVRQSGQTNGRLQSSESTREVYVTPAFGDGSWGKPVELPPIKLKQEKQGGRWVFV